MTQRIAKSRGFTIVELLIATAVFSLVLLVSIVGFLQIGQIFYKGVTATRTHETTRNITNSLVSDIRFAPSASQILPQPSDVVSGAQYFCAGSHRYTFMLGRMVDRSGSELDADKFGLIKDTLPVADSCGDPFDPPNSFSDDAEELLGNRMRLTAVSVQRLGTSPPDTSLNNLYTITVKIAYGDDSALQNTTDPDPANITCDSGLRTSQYCHVSTLTTTIRRGF